MKEVTEWNGHPRWMWVWDTEENKNKLYVCYILTDKEKEECGSVFPVLTSSGIYRHCAEIEEETPKEGTTNEGTLLNNYEFGQLLKCYGIEWKSESSAFTETAWSYTSEEENEKPSFDDLKIRFKQGEWMPATRETVMKWYHNTKDDGWQEIARFVEFMEWGS